MKTTTWLISLNGLRRGTVTAPTREQAAARGLAAYAPRLAGGTLRLGLVSTYDVLDGQGRMLGLLSVTRTRHGR